VKNRHRLTSINDAAWSLFTDWVDHYAKVFRIWAIAVTLHYQQTVRVLQPYRYAGWGIVSGVGNNLDNTQRTRKSRR